MIKKLSQKGFTLIELLVVVAIISLLSSIVMGALNDARAKARDRAMIQTVRQIQTALELYRQKYGKYPDGRAPGVEAKASYWSRIRSDDTTSSSSSGAGMVSLESKLQEFIPDIKFTTGYPSTDFIFHYYSYYNGETASNGRATCAGLSETGPFPPYVILFKTETNAFDNLPVGRWTNTILAPAWTNNQPPARCVTIE